VTVRDAIEARRVKLMDRIAVLNSFELGGLEAFAQTVDELEALRDLTLAILAEQRGLVARELVYTAVGALQVGDVDAAEDALLELLAGGRR
jgi:hypothetical protein